MTKFRLSDTTKTLVAHAMFCKFERDSEFKAVEPQFEAVTAVEVAEALFEAEVDASSVAFAFYKELVGGPCSTPVIRQVFRAAFVKVAGEKFATSFEEHLLRTEKMFEDLFGPEEVPVPDAFANIRIVSRSQH